MLRSTPRGRHPTLRVVACTEENLGAGAVQRTELFDGATKGTTASGQYQQATGTTTSLVLAFADHQAPRNKN